MNLRNPNNHLIVASIAAIPAALRTTETGLRIALRSPAHGLSTAPPPHQPSDEPRHRPSLQDVRQWRSRPSRGLTRDPGGDVWAVGAERRRKVDADAHDRHASTTRLGVDP